MRKLYDTVRVKPIDFIFHIGEEVTCRIGVEFVYDNYTLV